MLRTLAVPTRVVASCSCPGRAVCSPAFLTVPTTMAQPDVLDSTVAFLQKREGIDKTLKVLRYAARLALATAVQHDSELHARLSAFESSVGTSRKAFRLGKFLGQVSELRRTRVHGPYAALEWLAAGGECLYYFLEQGTWLVKAGLLPPRYAAPLSKWSARSELCGYLGSISLSLLRISLLLEREAALLAQLDRLRQWQRKQQQQPGAAAAEDDDSAAAAKSLRGEIQLLRQRRLLRTLSLVQDAADLLMLLPDLRPLGPGRKRGLLYHPATLSLCGLVSGLLSGYKNWPGGRKA